MLTAACILIVFAFSSFEAYNHFTPSFTHNYVSNDKNLNNLSLPDNSTISLDINTSLKVTYFNEKRNVVLEKGKAMFSVSKDKTRPFIIKSGTSQIEVLGTVFEVDNINGKNTTVAVKEGQYLNVNKNGKIQQLQKVNPTHIASWESGYLYFEKTTIKEAFERFSRYVDIEVNFDTYENTIHKVDGQFNINEFDKFLYILPKIYPIKIDKKGNEVFIKSI